MSLPKPDLHVRVSPDCKAALSLLAEVDQVPESVLASHLLEECVLGRVYTLKLAARRLRRQGLAGSDRDDA